MVEAEGNSAKEEGATRDWQRHGLGNHIMGALKELAREAWGKLPAASGAGSVRVRKPETL
jgi:hypothetical protein